MAKKKADAQEGTGIDIEIGGSSLGGLFKGIGNLIDLVAKMIEEGQTEISRTGEIKGLGREDIRGVYGVRIRTLAGGEPQVESFGNITRTPQGPRVEEVSEPLVDIFDEPDVVLVIAELPGVEERDIHLDIQDDILELSAEGERRKYHKEILLPTVVDPQPLSISYKNGIFEVKLAKTEAR